MPLFNHKELEFAADAALNPKKRRRRSNTFLSRPCSTFALSEAAQLQARGSKVEVKALRGPTCVKITRSSRLYLKPW